MDKTQTNVSERHIFRATHGLALGASLKRTLAYCLYWMQHATHFAGDIPMIWKTGPELQRDLAIDQRTGNRHMKTLAERGYWSISYAPKPGTIGNVTWLTLSASGAALLDLAEELSTADAERRSERPRSSRSNDPECTSLMSQLVTSKQTIQAKKTTKGQAEFLLSGEAKKEALISPGNLPGVNANPPNKLKVSDEERMFARVMHHQLTDRDLSRWDWGSGYTWAHIGDIVARLKKHGFSNEVAWSDFVGFLLENWSWLRLRLSYKYRDYPSNRHAPSPMAFAFAFDSLISAYEETIKPAPSASHGSSLDEGL